MHTLESYLNDGIHRDREDIAAIERVLAETGETIDENFNGQTHDWPYEIRREPSTQARKFSQSTTTMMINAIDLLGEDSPRGVCEPYPFVLGDLGKTLVTKRQAAFKALVADIKRQRKVEGQSVALPFGTFSETYGSDDPLTLSFLSEVLSPTSAGDEGGIRSYAVNRAKQLLSLDPAKDIVKFFDFSNPRSDGKKAQTSTPLTNAFIPLRVIRACQLLNVCEEDSQGAYFRYFESTLHDQLSYSSIPDSRFDPAELVFCLEGVLRLSEQSVDTRLFERVLEVLEMAQSTSAHWRPNKPFLRSERGLVLFPVSVEAANSLRWSCAKLDENERFYSHSERYMPLFRRFWEWLAARRVTFGPGKSGWHSDHVADPDALQLWDTAQVVGFLLGYRRSLHRHIARTTLRLARFDVRKPEILKAAWSEETRTLQEQRNVLPRRKLESSGGNGGAPTRHEDKKTVLDAFEPVTSLGEGFRTYLNIEKAFLLPWLRREALRNSSMLLYGPPGTGKTTVAKNIADALGFPMITITVSDFLAGGGATVEAQAKRIFEVLQAQTDCVILFDEIDELVLDRSSKRQENQDTVFKFMTPGMLTKLNNLRAANRSIFIMATNYAYRIDPAIRRTGRIDENYLLLPPDHIARAQMLEGFLSRAKEGSPLRSLAPIPDALIEASFFLGFTDIQTVVQRVLRLDTRLQTEATLGKELLNVGRTTTLEFYRHAFKETEDRSSMNREFLPLVHMAATEGKKVAEHDPALSVTAAAEALVDPSGARIYDGAMSLQNEAAKFVASFEVAGQ